MEQSFIAYLRGRCRHLPQVAVGIGDDAAVLDGFDGQQVACTDQIVDGVDFDAAKLEAEGHSLSDIGYKAMAINLSDIAAMGASAEAALVTLALPKEGATRLAGAVYEGILNAAQTFGVSIAGGDLTTYEGPLSVSVTLLGRVPVDGAWLRSGASEGEAILLSGPVGGSILGRHLHPRPRLDLPVRLRDHASVTAAIDVSDGLSLDLDRLCAASGIGAELDVDQIPVHADARKLAETTGRDPFDHAWSDGEDFEVLLTMSHGDADRVTTEHPDLGLVRIGSTVGRTGLWKKDGGKLTRLAPQGYMHSTR